MKIAVNVLLHHALSVAIDEAIVWRIFEVFRLMNMLCERRLSLPRTPPYMIDYRHGG